MPPAQLNPNLPVVDPNSPLGRRLLGRQQPNADQLFDVIGPDVGTLRLQQGSPVAQPEGGPGRSGIASPAVPLASAPTPAELASGNVAVAPVPTMDPFRVNDRGLGPVRGRQEGDLFRYDMSDPRQNNPFLYDDNGTWRSSVQRGGMTADGFQPGFVNNGLGGSQVWAGSAPDFLIAMQQNARAKGVNPGQLAEQFLVQLGGTADRSGRAAVGAQATNEHLASQRMQYEAQRDAARTASEGQARAAAFSAIPGLVAGLSAGNVPPAIAELMGNHITQGLGGGFRPPGAAPGAGSAVPGAPGPSGAPGLPGATGGASPFAALAAGGAALRPFQATFGTKNAQGVFARPEGFNLATATSSLLDRFRTLPPNEQAAMVAAVEGGDLGNAEELLREIGRQGAVSTARTHGGTAPGRSTLGNLARSSGLARLFMPGEDASQLAPQPFAIRGPGGTPVLELRADPNQNAAAGAFGTLASGGVDFNQAVYPGFDPIPFARRDVRELFTGPGRTPEVDQARGMSAMDFIRATSRYRNATGGR